MESRLSNLCNDDPDGDGVRFFFVDLARRELLFEVLGASEQDRKEITALADEQLQAGGTPPPRLLVDLTGFEGQRVDLGAALVGLLTDEPIVQPVQLLVTAKQAHALPYAFGLRPKVSTSRWSTPRTRRSA